MRLLSITLMLVATAILVHSAPASEGFGQLLERFEHFVTNRCESQPEGKIKECYQDIFETIRDFGSASLWAIKPCSCKECYDENIERAEFDSDIYEMYIEDCKDEEGEELANCMDTSFNENVGDFEFKWITPEEEYDILKGMARGCHDKGKKGKDLEECVAKTYIEERANEGEKACQENGSRDLKLYNSLRALLLKHYQK